MITLTSRNSKRNSFCENYTYNYIFQSVRNLNCNHFGADSKQRRNGGGIHFCFVAPSREEPHACVHPIFSLGDLCLQRLPLTTPLACAPLESICGLILCEENLDGQNRAIQIENH